MENRPKKMSKNKKILYIVSGILGVIAAAGFTMAAIGESYGYETLRFVGFLLSLPFLILISGIIVSYARV